MSAIEQAKKALEAGLQQIYHDGVSTEPSHPKRIAATAMESALAALQPQDLPEAAGIHRAMTAQAVTFPDVDWFANVIRTVDGQHKLGAGALAEMIVEAMLREPVATQAVALTDASISDFVSGYECDTGEGIYTPNDHERFIIEDAISTFLAAHTTLSAAPAPQGWNAALQAAAVIVEEIDIEEGETKYVEGNSAYELDQAAKKIRAMQVAAPQPQEPIAYLVKNNYWGFKGKLKFPEEMPEPAFEGPRYDVEIPLYAAPVAAQQLICHCGYSQSDALDAQRAEPAGVEELVDDADQVAAQQQDGTLRKALEAVLRCGRGTSGRIILEQSEESAIRAALAAHPAQDKPQAGQARELPPLPWEKDEFNFSFHDWHHAENRTAFDVAGDFRSYAREYAMAAQAAPAVPDDLRRAGARMANVLFNLVQNDGRQLTKDECALLKKLQREWDDALAASPSAPAQPRDHEFKNFHRLLCERFDYFHDEHDWKRDQLSLIEHLANSAAPTQTVPKMVKGLHVVGVLGLAAHYAESGMKSETLAGYIRTIASALAGESSPDEAKGCMNCGTQMCDRGTAHSCGAENKHWTPAQADQPKRVTRVDDFGVAWEVTPEQAAQIDAAKAAQADQKGGE
jgi:hypothetical protein